jgi:hypothetical protein
MFQTRVFVSRSYNLIIISNLMWSVEHCSQFSCKSTNKSRIFRFQVVILIQFVLVFPSTLLKEIILIPGNLLLFVSVWFHVFLLHVTMLYVSISPTAI